MSQRTLRSPYAGMMNAAHDHYDAVRAMNAHGEIAHVNALAQELVKCRAAATEASAVQMAAVLQAHTIQLAAGVSVNRAARKALDKRAREARVKDVHSTASLTLVKKPA